MLLIVVTQSVRATYVPSNDSLNSARCFWLVYLFDTRMVTVASDCLINSSVNTLQSKQTVVLLIQTGCKSSIP